MRNLTDRNLRIMRAIILACFVPGTVAISFSQTSALDGPWSGWAQCKLTAQGPGYSHQETQTWTLSGGSPAVQGAMRVFAATWSVSGGGSLERTTGSQTLKAQWTRNGSVPDAPIALFNRASDGKLILKSWHAQLRTSGAGVLTQQQIINGVPQTPGSQPSEAFEYTFPASEVAAGSKNISGSNTSPAAGSIGPMQAGAQATAACSWQFAAGNGTVGPPPPVENGTQNTGGATPGGSNPGGANSGGTSSGGTNSGGTSPNGGNSGGTNSGTTVLTLTNVSPSSAQQGNTATVTLSGTGFVTGAVTADFGPGVTSASGSQTTALVVTSPTSATASIKVDPQAAPGARSITLSRATQGSAQNQTSGLANGFTVTAAPVVAKPLLGQAAPNAAMQGAKNVQITLAGQNTHFAQGKSTVDFGPGIRLNSAASVLSPTTIAATVTIDPSAATGTRLIKVTTDKEIVTLQDGFQVVSTPGGITQVSPNHVTAGVTSTMNVTVKNMTLVQDHVDVQFGASFFYISIKVTSPTTLTVVGSFDAGASGPVGMKISNDAGQTAQITDAPIIDPAPPAPRYRISINGFQVNHETNAGPFGREHNAVFAAAAVGVLDRRNNLAPLQAMAIVRSLTHGDTSKAAGRIKAGSASPTGGLLAGDTFPTGQNPAAATTTPSATTFPFLLWQGPLTDGVEVVEVRPTLWVSNGQTETYDAWSTQVVGPVAGDGTRLIPARINSLDMSPVSAGPSIDIFCVDLPAVYESAHHVNCAPSDDRPIGLTGACYSLGGCWNNIDVLITRESIEKALSSPYQAGGIQPGIIKIHLADGGAGSGTAQFLGNYDLFLRVERVP